MLSATKHFVATKVCRDKLTFVATNICLSRQRDKHAFVATKDVFCCDKHVYVVTKVSLSQQNICRDKHTFIATKVLRRDSHNIVATEVLSRQK